MAHHRYLHLDVFTDHAFGGNQLAVFPDGRGISSETMQDIAREMNFSETTFVLPAEDPATNFRVRIFTIDREMPMAGHPTIGTTFALAHLGRIKPQRDGESIVLGLGIGPIPVELKIDERSKRLNFAWMTQLNPTFGRVVSDVAQVARCLNLPPESLAETRLPIQVVSCGLPLLYVPVTTRALVDTASVDSSALRLLSAQEGIADTPVFVFTTEGATNSANEFIVYSRMFAPSFGIVEDPATGGAGGPLGCYLVHYEVVDKARSGSIINLQGFAMKRPSRIHIAIESNDGEITRVRVGGQAVVVGEGALQIDD